jgi:hypothetical protein
MHRINQPVENYLNRLVDLINRNIPRPADVQPQSACYDTSRNHEPNLMKGSQWQRK